MRTTPSDKNVTTSIKPIKKAIKKAQLGDYMKTLFEINPLTN